MPRLLNWTEATAIGISGADRVKWLNNLVTNDVRNASGETLVECFVTDVKGRTLSHGVVYAQNESLIYLSWGAGQAERLLSHFDRYIIREDVLLTDLSDSFRWSWSERSASRASHDLTDGSIRVLNHPALGDGWCLVQQTPLNDQVESSDERSEKQIDGLRIQTRWPIIHRDYDDKNLPQELDRDATAISFTKGCYLGQETVARLDALGQVQKKLVKLTIEGPTTTALDRGASLTKGGQDAGVLTSIALDEASNRRIALGYVRRAFFAKATELDCNGLKAVVA